MDSDCSSDLSIVIQGSIGESTEEIIKTFRRIFPDAEIIISTWENQDTSMIDADKIVYSKDPGNFLQNRMIEGSGRYNNINRQIVSSIEGLRAATRKYALKTRSDIFIEKTDWLQFYGKYENRSPATLFQKRVLTCNYYSRNPRIFPLPFHWSDWVFFGETIDITQIFDLSLMTNEDAYWFDTHQRSKPIFRDNINRYLPEQWLCSEFLRKHMQLSFDCFYDDTCENIILTERVFAENITILDLNQWGIRFLKYNPNKYYDKTTLLFHRDWKVLYRRYCLKKTDLYWKIYLVRCKSAKLIHGFIRPRLMLVLRKAGMKKILYRILGRIR